MSEKKSKLRLRLMLLYLCRFSVLAGPLCGVLIANRARYFTTLSETVRIAVGGSICMLFVFLLVIGVLKPPGTLYMFGFVFLMSWLLSPLIKDLFLLSGVAFGSKFLDFAVFEPLVRATRAKIGIRKTAESTAGEVEEVLKKYLGRV